MRFLIHEVRLFFIALQFFTRVPVPAWVGYHPDWLQACQRYFPLVGALVGCAGALMLALTANWWPPLVAVILSMAFTVWLTGGFHEDGWADTCDALGGSVSRERALEIMKDSRIGSYGSLGLILLLGLKAATLSSLATPVVSELNSAQTSHIHQVLLAWTMMALIWCHTGSRLVAVWLIRLLPYGGDLAHAKAKPLGLQASWGQVIAATCWTVVVAACMWLWLAQSGWPTGTLTIAVGRAALAMLIGGIFCWRWFKRRLGGFTGDTLGATQQLTEVLGLLAWLTVIHPVG